jgi:integrase
VPAAGRVTLHLLPYFGRLRMAEIDTALVRRYIAKRQTDRIIIQKARTLLHRDGRREELPELTKSVSNAEINRELQILKRCFNLAIEEGRPLHAPHIPMLRKNNVRKGFLDPAQLQDVLSFLPTELQPIIRFAYITGWRIATEVLPLTWNRVDFDAGEVRLDTSKNGEGRVFPMNDDLRALLKAQHRERERPKRKPDTSCRGCSFGWLPKDAALGPALAQAKHPLSRVPVARPPLQSPVGRTDQAFVRRDSSLAS